MASPPGIVGAVIRVNGEARVVAHKTAGHFDRIQAAGLQLCQKLAVETINVVDVAKQGVGLFAAERSTIALVAPKVEVTLRAPDGNSHQIK